MEYIFVLIIVLCVTAYICYPFIIGNTNTVFFNENMKGYTEAKKSKLEILEDDKLELYSAIKEIDFDYGMGKLSEQDYKELRNEYLHKASLILKEIEKHSVQGTEEAKDRLEEEIMRAKHEIRTAEDEIEIEIKKKREKKDLT